MYDVLLPNSHKIHAYPTLYDTCIRYIYITYYMYANSGASESNGSLRQPAELKSEDQQEVE